MMRYLALAVDYDGTLAADGQVEDSTVAALIRLRNTGRRLILVTGRLLDDLLDVFPHVQLFERVVAENGALLYHPATGEARRLADQPPAAFVEALHQRDVIPLSVGQVIVATWHPNEAVVLDVIRELGLELQLIFNKGAVMILPSGVNKASGLSAALTDLKLSPHNVVGIGDAENDHAFLELCECAGTVANALPMLKERADLVTEGARGAGVIELIDRIVASDLRELAPDLRRHAVILGTRDDGAEVRLTYGENLLLTGTSGSGKSTVAAAALERLGEQGYQFCIIDPEGDYEHFPGAVVLGDSRREPGVAEILELLEQPDQNAVINMLGIALEDRPAFFEGLLPRIQELRARTGRPHWIVIDEAHHLLPASLDAATLLPQALEGMILITVHPGHVAPAVLSLIDTVIAVGETPMQAMREVGARPGQPPPHGGEVALAAGQALIWARSAGTGPFRFQVLPPRAERQRHQRKYVEGELGKDKSFYFRGPQGRLNLRAQNLLLFVQLAEGVDDATWAHHLREGDYSRWFRTVIKDDQLADEAAGIERQADLPPRESRERIRQAIERRYTLPA